MPRYRRHRESQANPEAETVRAYPRVRIRPRPHSPRTPTAQDYEESLRPATATSPHDPITPDYAHPCAQDRAPAQGQWWRHWTHTQLWELRKWARAEPSLEGLVNRPRKGSVENCRLQLAGGLMPQAAWAAMLAHALHPLGVHPSNLCAPQDHPYVLMPCGPPLPGQPTPRSATSGPAEKTTSQPEAEGRHRKRQRAPLRPKAPNPSPQPSQPPTPARAPTRIQPEPHPKPLTLDS